MRLLAPEWLLLLPVFLALGLRFRPLALWRPLRVICLLLLVVLLVNPQVRRGDTALDLWVLVDRSASALDLIEPRLEEWEALIERGKGPHDRVRYLDFAAEAMLRDESDRGEFAGDRQQTRIALAIRHVLSRMDSGRANRVLLLSDGYSTEPLEGLAERLVAQHAPLDFRWVTPPEAVDVRIDELRLPPVVQLGEPFLIEADVVGDANADVPYDVYLHDTPVGSGTVALRGGRARIRLTDRLLSPGSHRYEVVLRPEVDAFPGNNRARQWIEVTAGPQLLLISGFLDDPLAGILRAQGFDMEHIVDPARLHAGQLTGARAVIFNDVPAYRLPGEFLASLDFFVRQQGGGLLMLGGPFSFGSGGYFESMIDPLLPVSMELKEEHRMLQVAVAIVMDRSGSMGASVAAGGARVTKMDLANEGAARVIELLGPRDAVTVSAVDTRPHLIVPLTEVGAVRGELLETVRRIGSQGGGIYVYTGLKAAWEELEKSPGGQRHIILFTDAADSEEPGDYKNLIAMMVEQGATISVIGIGTEQDRDAEFIKDVARRGNGRIFFSNDARELPALFAQEAVSVARSSFVEEPTPTVPSAGWLALADRGLDWMPQVDGYNLSYLRPDATAGLFTGDEYEAPLVAFWQRGLGRAAAVTFPMGGEHGAAVLGWPGYGDFAQTLGRWLLGDPQPPGLGLRHALIGNTLIATLLYDREWEETISLGAPRFLLQLEGEDEMREVVWERMEPGRYRAVFEMPDGAMARGAVQVGDTAMPFGPVTAGIGEEWSFSRERLLELETISRLSGGERRTDLTDIWEAPRRTGERDIRVPVLTLFLFCLLLEALVTRSGGMLPRIPAVRSLPRIRWPRPARRPRGRRELPPPLPPTGDEDEDGPPRSDADEWSEAALRRRQRFARAKRRFPDRDGG